jgi:hypothetical protein
MTAVRSILRLDSSAPAQRHSVRVRGGHERNRNSSIASGTSATGISMLLAGMAHADVGDRLATRLVD